jgi:hypothetical protein
MIFVVLVATVCVVTSAGYGRIRPGQGIGAVGALAARGSHVSETEQGSANAPKLQGGHSKLAESHGHEPANPGHRHPHH